MKQKEGSDKCLCVTTVGDIPEAGVGETEVKAASLASVCALNLQTVPLHSGGQVVSPESIKACYARTCCLFCIFQANSNIYLFFKNCYLTLTKQSLL